MKLDYSQLSEADAIRLAKLKQYVWACNVKESWDKGDLSYKLHSAQRLIYDAIRGLPFETREAVVFCARRFGKSYLGVLMAIEDCIRFPGTIVRTIGPTIKQTTEIIVPLINKVCCDAPSGLIKRTKSEHRWKIGESSLILGGFDSSNVESHRGSESSAIYLEETRDSSAEEYTNAMFDVLKPQLLHSKGKMVHLTTAPKAMSHPFVTDTIPQAKLNNAFFKYTVYQNPLLDQEQIDSAIRDCGGINTQAFRREYMCELIRDEQTLIAPEFDPSKHVFAPDLPDAAYYNTVVDLGGVRDKTACLLVIYDFFKAKKVLWDERIFDANTPTTEIIKGCLEMEANIKRIIPDEKYGPVRWMDAPGQIQVDLYDTHKFEVRLPLKDDWEASINALKVAFAQDKWIVHPRCKHSIENLLSGTFNKNRTDFERSHVFGHNDAIAALMYANRMINTKENPFSESGFIKQSSHTFQRPVDSPMEEVSKTLQPKSFGHFRIKR